MCSTNRERCRTRTFLLWLQAGGPQTKPKQRAICTRKEERSSHRKGTALQYSQTALPVDKSVDTNGGGWYDACQVKVGTHGGQVMKRRIAILGLLCFFLLVPFSELRADTVTVGYPTTPGTAFYAVMDAGFPGAAEFPPRGGPNVSRIGVTWSAV